MRGRLGRPREQHRELAAGELGADVGAVASLVEQVGIGVEGHAGAGVAEDTADLDDVEADVDDQVAGERVAQVVEPHSPAVVVEPGVDGCSAQHPLRDVVVQERRSACGCEHVVGVGGEP
jgi:hypothetical protein